MLLLVIFLHTYYTFLIVKITIDFLEDMTMKKISQLLYVAGHVEKIIYTNLRVPNSPYSVFTIRVEDTNTDSISELIKITTNNPPPASDYAGTYRFYGEFIFSPKYGQTFNAEAYVRTIPTTGKRTVEFLASGLFKGIGKKKAQDIVDALGEDCLLQIVNDPEVLSKVKGIPQKKYELIHEKLLENISLERILPHLFEWNLSLSKSIKIYKQFGDASIEKIEENPYCLANNIPGIGFERADSIAKKLSFENNSMKRIKGAIEHVLHKIYHKEGSTYTHKDYLLEKTQKLLEEQDGVPIEIYYFEQALTELTSEEPLEDNDFISDIGKIQAIGDRIFLRAYWLQELEIAKQLFIYHRASPQKKELYTLDNIVDKILQAQDGMNMKFSLEQTQAIYNCLPNQLSLITGGPGTGKTTVINAIIMVYVFLQQFSEEELLRRIILLAPTGRAAKKMHESTQLPSQTIHSYLMTFEQGFPTMEERLVIIDEVSMLDIQLMHNLLNKLTEKDKLILIGDEKQLPSIKAGNILSDILNSNLINVVKLQQIFRQDEASSIITLASKIREERDDEIYIEEATKDSRFIKVSSKNVKKAIVGIMKKLIEDKDFALKDIQILVPIHRSETGITSINNAIQDALLSGIISNQAQRLTETPFKNDKFSFYVGDKVIQLRNDPEKNIFNGDIGYIQAFIPDHYLQVIDEDTNESINQLIPEHLVVSFNQHEVHYTAEELDDLSLAYCFSVHKSQGSEFPVVIIPFSNNYTRMLSRPLIYTAITRAKDKLIMIGESQIFYTGIKNQQQIRYTALSSFLHKLDRK